MRIAVVEPDSFGGLLHYATQLADALAERGHSVDLICARKNELAGRVGPARRRLILPPGNDGSQIHSDKPRATLRRARTALRLARTWVRIAFTARFGRYDVILLDGSIDLALTAYGARVTTLVSAKKTVTTHVCHNVRPFNRWGGSELFVDRSRMTKLLGRTYSGFDLVFVHGDRAVAEYKDTYPPTKIAVIPHGDERIFSEEDEAPVPASEPRILFFGGWNKVKGLPVLMEAFDALVKRRPEARLTIAGSPVPEEGQAALVLPWAEARSSWVDVHPNYVPLHEVPALFASARVVVMPYLTGYQSGVVHLAMTMQRAVVASDVGDFSAAVDDGVTGLLVPSGDVPALVDALDAVLGDELLAERLGAAGRERVMSESGWPVVAERVERALQGVIHQR